MQAVGRWQWDGKAPHTVVRPQRSSHCDLRNISQVLSLCTEHSEGPIKSQWKLSPSSGQWGSPSTLAATASSCLVVLSFPSFCRPHSRCFHSGLSLCARIRALALAATSAWRALPSPVQGSLTHLLQGIAPMAPSQSALPCLPPCKTATGSLSCFAFPVAPPFSPLYLLPLSCYIIYVFTLLLVLSTRM